MTISAAAALLVIPSMIFLMKPAFVFGESLKKSGVPLPKAA
jgi:hypothetical protein